MDGASARSIAKSNARMFPPIPSCSAPAPPIHARGRISQQTTFRRWRQFGVGKEVLSQTRHSGESRKPGHDDLLTRLMTRHSRPHVFPVTPTKVGVQLAALEQKAGFRLSPE